MSHVRPYCPALISKFAEHPQPARRGWHPIQPKAQASSGAGTPRAPGPSLGAAGTAKGT